jgi:uncharacterized membrane protein
MIYVFLSLVTYSAAIMIATYANRNAKVSLVALVVNIISVIVPAIIVASKWSDASKGNSKLGLVMAVLGGIVISVFTLALGKAYEQNNVAIVAPIVFGGSIVITAILSMILFKEKIELLQGIGLLVVSIGLGIVIYSKVRA